VPAAHGSRRGAGYSAARAMPSPSPAQRRLLVLVAVLAALLYGWFDVANRARIDRGPKYHRTDFTVYQAAAAALVEGSDPYEARNPRGYRYVYPPLLAVLLMPVAGLPPPVAALLFFLASATALALALWKLGKPALAGALLCAPFLHESFERGQVTVLLLALQVLAFTSLSAGRRFTSGLLLAIGTALRLTPALPAAALGLGLLAGRTGFRRYAAGFAAGIALGFAAAPAAALGPSRAVQVLERWYERSTEVFAAEPGGFGGLDGVNEYRFKNQSVRRVLATSTGWLLDVEFRNEQPALPPGALQAVDVAAYSVAGVCALLAVAIGGGWARRTRARSRWWCCCPCS
jgi:Glycosyltransferase family 87